jgi:RNA polymerase sigma-70 factor, ECF subfamily
MSADLIPLRGPMHSDTRRTDDELARACASGDTSAISELFDRFYRPVARYLQRLSFAPAEVEDLVQQVFVEVVRGKARYDGRASVTTWLFAIATNIARHHRRASGRRLRLMASLAASGRGAATPTTEGRVSARDELRRAQLALEALSSELREAFVLCELEGFSAREAGGIVGASEGAVWKRVSKARRAIRRQVLEGSDT